MAVMRSNPVIIALVRPACDRAIDRALHEANPDRFHERLNTVCPYCQTISERFAKRFAELSASPANDATKERMRLTMERIMAAQGIDVVEVDDAEPQARDAVS